MATILIVDDDADLLVAVSDAVVDEGWTVLAAASRPAAIDLARRNRIDVVLADLSLADGEGQALEQALRALGPGGSLPFVFMTGSPLQGRALGGSTVVIKPFDVHEVTTALEDALRPHRFVRREARPAAVPARTPDQAPAVARARTGS